MQVLLLKSWLRTRCNNKHIRKRRRVLASLAAPDPDSERCLIGRSAHQPGRPMVVVQAPPEWQKARQDGEPLFALSEDLDLEKMVRLKQETMEPGAFKIKIRPGLCVEVVAGDGFGANTRCIRCGSCHPTDGFPLANSATVRCLRCVVSTSTSTVTADGF